MKNDRIYEKVLKPAILVGLVMSSFFSGCDAFNAGTEFSSGRRAFMAKKYDDALPHFQKVAETKPDYVFESLNFRQGVWSYLGRAQYLTGKTAEARASLERALTANPEEPLARIYLGLVLARGGDEANAARELKRGLSGLQSWLEYENGHNPSQTMWDPNREIRKEIGNTLSAIDSKSLAPGTLIENGEWIGWAMEEEIDKVRRDKTRQTD